MAKSKAKKLSFRQRLRTESGKKLESIQEDVTDAVKAAVDSHNTEINPYDVMRLLCTGMTKTLRERLVTELSNETENELEAIYNRQQGLDLEDTNVTET